MPRKTSIVHNREAVQEAIDHSESLTEVLTYLNLRAAGGNFLALKNSCAVLGLTLPQYDWQSQSTKVKAGLTNRISNAEVFVEDSPYTSRKMLKKRLFEIGVPNICDECGQEPFWNGKPLTLTLEHKNGVWNDNRLDNLQILCGHCHSQTDTFSGRSSHSRNNDVPDFRPTRVQKHCLGCNKEITRSSTYCMNCAAPLRQAELRESGLVIEYPEINQLIESVQHFGFVQTAKTLGVTDSALRKHMKKFLPLDHFIFRAKNRRHPNRVS
jgi:hypothetical protein